MPEAVAGVVDIAEEVAKGSKYHVTNQSRLSVPRSRKGRFSYTEGPSSSN